MSTTKPLISILMPVFNGGDFLPLALESVRVQDYPNLEIIAVDDGSSDNSRKILEEFSISWTGRMKVLTHPDKSNKGIAASCKLSLEKCRGEFIAFLEQDDAWSPNKISEQVKAFEMFPNVGVVFSDVYPCDERGNCAEKPFKPLINKPPSEMPFNAFWRLLWGNYILTFSNTMVKRNVINASDLISSPGGFEDWMFLLLISSRFKFYLCSKAKVFWLQRQDSYHAKLRRTPGYRKLRKLALRNAIERILLERQPSSSIKHLKKGVHKNFWFLTVSLLNSAEMLAGFLNSKLCNERITSYAEKTQRKNIH